MQASRAVQALFEGIVCTAAVRPHASTPRFSSRTPRPPACKAAFLLGALRSLTTASSSLLCAAAEETCLVNAHGWNSERIEDAHVNNALSQEKYLLEERVTTGLHPQHNPDSWQGSNDRQICQLYTSTASRFHKAGLVGLERGHRIPALAYVCMMISNTATAGLWRRTHQAEMSTDEHWESA